MIYDCLMFKYKPKAFSDDKRTLPGCVVNRYSACVTSHPDIVQGLRDNGSSESVSDLLN